MKYIKMPFLLTEPIKNKNARENKIFLVNF